MSTVVLASRNPHKIVEVRRILAEAGLVGLDLRGLDAFPGVPEVAEVGVTFTENAILKAVGVAEATGLPAIADDSGLCVDVLGGAPGVFSARWCGRHGDDRANLELLLAQLHDVPDAHRGARFSCAAVAVLPGRRQLAAVGELLGVLIRSPRGGHGFGYDPIFVPQGETRTTAEMLPADKDAISHRGRAFRELAALLRTTSMARH